MPRDDESVFYAHTLPGRPAAEWEKLEDHLREVSELAAGFGRAFEAEEWARLAGRWHDLGKYSEEFQTYIRAVAEVDPHQADGVTKTDHSTAGAQHAIREIDVIGHLLAYVIAGHHSGLLDAISDGACLESRLSKTVAPIHALAHSIHPAVSLSLPSFLANVLGDRARAPFSLAFFTRMLFSCLVDADFLATEKFMDPERSSARYSWPIDILERLAQGVDAFLAGFGRPKTLVDRERAGVLAACREAAESAPGFFSLTVPTGGGKTLSSLTFALQHAQHHRQLERVIYVAPFTTIIEQNADVFRTALRALTEAELQDPVLEHHSNLDSGVETTASRLAMENWDAPLVVTTSVQFYESLFGNRSAQCRKLHRMARSVVILDEAQTLPVDYLKPCLRALQELVEHYGATVVLCTATQPAIHRRPDFDIGIGGVREIVPDAPKLYETLRRVSVVDLGELEDNTLADRLLAEKQVLCVVNTRKHARLLSELLGNHGSHYHLSALMCPAHRTRVLESIRQRLASGRACRVVSTQLIEAGVDIDFPVVYRSLAGLDSIAQAAGRCNRHGRLDGLGKTYVFQSEHRDSDRFFAETADAARQVLARTRIIHEKVMTEA